MATTNRVNGKRSEVDTVFYRKALSNEMPGGIHRLSVVEITRDDATELMSLHRDRAELVGIARDIATSRIRAAEEQLGVHSKPERTFVKTGPRAGTEGLMLFRAAVIEKGDVEGWQEDAIWIQGLA